MVKSDDQSPVQSTLSWEFEYVNVNKPRKISKDHAGLKHLPRAEPESRAFSTETQIDPDEDALSKLQPSAEAS
jgi:hypothetical protein